MKVLKVILLVLLVSSASTRVGSVQRVLGPSDSVIPGQYVVMFDDGVDPRGLVNDLKSSGQAKFLREYSIINGFAVHMDINALENALNNIEGATIYDDMIAIATEVQSPVGSWGLDRVDQTVTVLDTQYKYERDGSNVDVYIIDTGIYINHTDFDGRASLGPDYTGEGNFDGSGHGTHVAGTVGGTENGIAKNVNLIAIKVLNTTGYGYLSWAIDGINWVVENAHPTRRAVINMSLGGDFWTPVNDAVKNAVAAGVIVTVSAGNGNEDACGRSPASAADAITVGATATNDARASYSNWGSNYGRCLDIFAPGVSIRSCSLTQGGSTFKSGTSMASPHVAGVAALLLDEDPALTPPELLDRMLADATPRASDEGFESPNNKLLYTGAINERATATSAPSSTPSVSPSSAPSLAPSSAPSQSLAPSSAPSLAPSSVPTPVPAPSSTPSVGLSSAPSLAPSSAPTPVPAPSSTPSVGPSSAPSLDPTTAPTPNCAAKFASCTIDSDCCKNKCNGNKKCAQ